MPRLIAAVYVQDPTTHEELVLLPGEEPSPEIAALIRNPEAWDVPPEPSEFDEPAPTQPRPTGPTPNSGQVLANQVGGAGGAAKKTAQRRARPSAE